MNNSVQKFKLGTTTWIDFEDGVVASGTDHFELAFEEMLKIKRDHVCLNVINIDGKEYSSSQLGSYDVAAIAKNLLQPWVEGKLQYPISVYVAALASDYCDSDLQLDAKDFGGKLHGDTEFNLSNIVAWVEANYVAHSISNGGYESLYHQHIKKRVDRVMAELKEKMPQHYAVIEQYTSITAEADTDSEFLETYSFADNEYTTALFTFQRKAEEIAA